MRCDLVRRKWLERELAGLPGSDGGALDLHLEGCERCRAALREDEALTRALGALAILPAPEVDVVSRVRTAAVALGSPDRRLVRPSELGLAATAAALVGVAVLGTGVAWRESILEALRTLRAVLGAGAVAAGGILRSLEPLFQFLARVAEHVLEPPSGIWGGLEAVFRTGVPVAAFTLAVAAATTVVVVGRDLLRTPAEKIEEVQP